MRITNKSGTDKRVWVAYGSEASYAIDTNSNQQNNTYYFNESDNLNVQHEVPLNYSVIVRKVPVTTSYFAVFQFIYKDMDTRDKNLVKFTGIHVPR